MRVLTRRGVLSLDGTSRHSERSEESGIDRRSGVASTFGARSFRVPQDDVSPGIRGRLNLRAIIIGAGRGARLKAMTDHQPKCYAQVGGRRILDWTLEAFERAGVTDKVF